MRTPTQAAGNADETLARYRRARAVREKWDALLADAYRFALPQYDGPAAGAGAAPRGSKRGLDVFDSTAEEALDERAARTHGQLFPPFQEWLQLRPRENGPENGGADGEEAERNAEIVRRFHAALELSNFHTEIASALREAYISLGCLNVSFGAPENPLVFEAVPVRRVAPEEGPDGVIRTVFLTFDIPARSLAHRYPSAVLPPALLRRIADDPDGAVEVVEANLWQPESRTTQWSVWLTEGEHCLLADRLAAPRTIAFRIDKAPGETMGRGPVIKALPDIKTANKVVELTLRNASIAVTGIWMADDDGVLNPANVRLAPGTIIPKAVGSQGLQALKPPGDFDVSQLVLEEMRARIRLAIVGPALPPPEDAVRTAYELGERRADQRAVEAPQTLRLLNELYEPLARRCLAILSHPAMAGSPFYIPRAGIEGAASRLEPTSPMLRIQDDLNRQSAMGAIAAAIQLLGLEAVARVVDLDAFARWSLEQGRFPAELMRREETAEIADASFDIAEIDIGKIMGVGRG